MVSLDGWQETMWNTQDAAGEATWIYFVVLLVLGNVLLVSVSTPHRVSSINRALSKLADYLYKSRTLYQLARLYREDAVLICMVYG